MKKSITYKLTHYTHITHYNTFLFSALSSSLKGFVLLSCVVVWANFQNKIHFEEEFNKNKKSFKWV